MDRCAIPRSVVGWLLVSPPWLAAALGASLVTCGTPAQARLPIELEVAIEAGASITAPQEWIRRLGKLDLIRVRMRSIRPADQPKITELQVGGSTRYQVLAILSRQDELLLPNQRFKARHRGALKAYFEQLPLEAQHNAAPRGRFDLTEKQFRTLFADLSRPVNFSTTGLTAREMLSRLEKTFTVPVMRGRHIAPPLSLPVRGELQGISTGTALAIALREHRLVLRPEQPRGEPFRLTIAAQDRQLDAWPVGWMPEKSARVVAPQLFEKLTIEIKDYSFARALTALQPRIKIPVLLDYWILSDREIVIEQAQVKLDRRKTYLKGVLDRLASQARLATELRVDELGGPFLWVTQFGDDSPRADRSE